MPEDVVIQHLITVVGALDDDALTKWEQDFITSVAEQWEEKGRLSPKQIEILTRIYKEKA